MHFSNPRLPNPVLFIIAISMTLVGCSGESGPQTSEQAQDTPVQSSSENVSAQPEAEDSGESFGTVTLNYGDSSETIERFESMGTNLLFAAGAVNLSLFGPEGAKISIGLQPDDPGSVEGTYFTAGSGGTEADKALAQVSVMQFIGADPGVQLQTGEVTVTKCDTNGQFVAEFSGEGRSLNPTVSGTSPFSGKIEVKVPVIQR